MASVDNQYEAHIHSWDDEIRYACSWRGDLPVKQSLLTALRKKLKYLKYGENIVFLS